MRLSIFKFFIFSYIFVCLHVSLEAQMLSRMQMIMGTYITLSVEEEKASLLEDGFKIIHSVDKSISSYNPDSYIYKLNENKISPLNDIAYEALQFSQKYYEKTDGYFNIAIGSVTKDLYAFGEDEKIPTQDELKNVHVNINGLQFNEKEACLGEGIKLDLGGMGKGFAVDYVSDYFKSKNVKEAIISASGDIRCLHTCKLEVNNPFSDDSLATFKTLHVDTGVSTSGNYNRYVGSTKHNHLINPKSKTSQDKFISITLISHMPNSDLDAYATAASVMPMKKAYEFLDTLDLGYIVLQSDKQLRVSENISLHVQNLSVNYK